MLTITERHDLINRLEDLSKNCDGVIMASRGGSCLHNFAYSMRTAMDQLKYGIDNGIREENAEHD